MNAVRASVPTSRPAAFRSFAPLPIHQRVAAARISGRSALLKVMAERMLDIDIGGACSEADLSRAGFTREEVSGLGLEAAAEAGRMLARRDATRAA